jgi:choline dehydrogenase-like flavoprotein
VGGGTAGLALATRLSQYLKTSSILLLEAGAAAPDEIRINAPGMRGSALFTQYDWNFSSIPQEALDGRSIDVNRGKVLGGSSALNYLCYDRAASGEYDTWGELASDKKTWSWKTMLPAMMKAENYTDDPSKVDPSVHGTSGPIRNRFNRIVPEQFETWIPTLTSLGIPHNEESLGGDNIGVMFQGTNIDDGHWDRSYSANGYLPLAGKNLVVKTNSRVVKVNFQKNSSPLKAVGVTLEDGTTFKANKEVVLSAGSIGSPMLLELSGVGQSAVLKTAGITPLLDLPGVGENYQDHIRVSTVYKLKDNYSSFDPFIYDPTSPFVQEQVQLWIDGKESWLDYTSTPYSFVNWGLVLNKTEEAKLVSLAKQGADANSVVDQAKLKWLADKKIPQLEIIMEANYVGINTYPGGPILTIFSSLMHPMSRGSTHIAPTSPATSKPVIDVNYFDNPYDRQAMIEGAKLTRKIANTEPMRSTWTSEFEPGTAVDTDAGWVDFIKKAVLTFFHPVGTCAMLPRKSGGVVDSELKVYGTEGLRVVDASVMSVLISAHIQTAVYGIAEIAASMIAEDA